MVVEDGAAAEPRPQRVIAEQPDERTAHTRDRVERPDSAGEQPGLELFAAEGSWRNPRRPDRTQLGHHDGLLGEQRAQPSQTGADLAGLRGSTQLRALVPAGVVGDAECVDGREHRRARAGQVAPQRSTATGRPGSRACNALAASTT